LALALKEPELVSNLVAVDNAPVDARLESDFARYIQGMKKIDEAGVTRQAEADKILEGYEKVCTYLHLSSSGPCPQLFVTNGVT
jgi:pimeloyl-ACP methyl ester carboxylesterase